MKKPKLYIEFSICYNQILKTVDLRLMGGPDFLQNLIIAVSPEDRIRMAERELALRSQK